MRKVLVACLFLIIASSGVLADTMGINFTQPGPSFSASTWSLGYQFVADSSSYIRALGTFDYGQDGFSQPQQVGLWDANGNLLASTYVTNADALNGYWRFNSISPLQMTTGATYYVAAQGGEGYTWNTAGFTVAPDIIFVRDAWHYTGSTANSPLAFPDQTENFTAAEGGAFFGGNILLSQSVPEPASLLLLGGGLLGLAALARRRMKKE